MKILLVVLVISCVACSSNNDGTCSDLNQKDLINCRNNDVFPDSLLIADQLPGQWRWVEHSGAYERIGELSCPDKNVIAAFTNDGQYDVVEDGIRIDQGSWQIVKWQDLGWRVEFDGANQYLNDWVWFCHDYVMFEPSDVVDAGYYIFQKED